MLSWWLPIAGDPRDARNSGQTSPQLAIMPLIDLVDHHLPIPESLGLKGKFARMWNKEQMLEVMWIEMGFQIVH